MSKSAFGTAVAAAFTAVLAVALLLLGTGSDPAPTRAQTASYDYEVLPCAGGRMLPPPNGRSPLS